MEDRQEHLNALVQSYLSTMADLGAETWLMHGTLMGWWWNRKVRFELTFFMLFSPTNVHLPTTHPLPVWLLFLFTMMVRRHPNSAIFGQQTE